MVNHKKEIKRVSRDGTYLFSVNNEHTKKEIINHMFDKNISFIPREEGFLIHQLDLKKVICVLGCYYNIVEVIE